MRLPKLLFSFACLLGTAQASAGVLYTWQMTKPSSTIHSAGGLLELTDQAVQSGGVSYSVRTSCNQDPCHFSDPTSPILRFKFWANNPKYGAYVNPIAGYGLMEMWDETSFDVSFSITGRRITDFSVYLWNWDTTMIMESGHIIQLSSDWPGCYTHCAGSSGFFREVNVPEPGSLPLIGLGILGLAYRTTRRSKKTTLDAHGIIVVNR